MRTLLKILLALTILLCGYLVWPRNPGFTHFDPETLAHADIKSWRAMGQGNWSAYTRSNYWVLDREFGFSPLTSLRMARSYTQAAIILVNAKDETEQKKALPFLKLYFALARTGLKTNLNSDILAERELLIWTQTASNKAEPLFLVMLASEQWAAFAGGNPKIYRSATTQLVGAARVYGTNGEPALKQVEKMLNEGYTKLLNAAIIVKDSQWASE
ncbi:MAG: hypothetical protein ABI615_07080 [Chthoniobacterales bacterium]